MTLNLDEVTADLAAFADDDNDALVDRNGHAIFYRSGACIECDIRETDDGGAQVTIDGAAMPYRRFISHYLGKLDVFAERLISKRPAPSVFIDGPSHLKSSALPPKDGRALELLAAECSTASPFASRVVFITADAGHGKTVLLKQYQSTQARDFISGRSPFLFWHVDLQGRQLLRLSEALMGDLGDLRLAGIWMASIIRLIRQRVLVLGIDGFDELAAEQGSTDALGALSLIVRELDDRGTIVAAARRTFFDTDEYVRRANLIGRRVSDNCEFDEIRLQGWTRSECVEYLSKTEHDTRRINDPSGTYDEILGILDGEESHPMLSRPFLLAEIAKGILLFDVTPADFIRGMKNLSHGVASIVGAFVSREVQFKWKSKETGEAYLSEAQHMRLLADVAEEMWRAQKDRLEVDVIETIATLLLDEWHIGKERAPQILQMVKMHALLTVPPDSAAQFRSFDHPEFRDYFVAHALSDRLQEGLERPSPSLGGFLSVASLPDSVARYAAAILAERHINVISLLGSLDQLVAQEWKPTFLQTNIGTIVPFLLDGFEPIGGEAVFSGRVVYTSLVFENTKLRRVHIENGEFVNVSFVGADWEDVRFVKCHFTELVITDDPSYRNVSFDNCVVDCVVAMSSGEEVAREYAPARVIQLLKHHGLNVLKPAQLVLAGVSDETTESRRLVERFLRVFRRATGISEGTIKTRLHTDAPRILEHLIPLMTRRGILESVPWRGGGPAQGRWVLRKSIDEILRAEGTGTALGDFWREVDM